MQGTNTQKDPTHLDRDEMTSSKTCPAQDQIINEASKATATI